MEKSVTDYMEEHLDMPLSEILGIIQGRIMTKSTYFGIPALRNPMDCWVYQEIIHETKPDAIIEIGNYCGGGTLWLAHVCDLLGKGRIIGLDISHAHVHDQVKKHSRITFIEGDAVSSFQKVKNLIQEKERVLIIEDSSHTYEHTLNVLRTFSPLIKPGDYFIVEDGIGRHGIDDGPDPGPYEAVETFVNENDDFELDRNKESFFLTWNPKGYLKRRTEKKIPKMGAVGKKSVTARSQKRTKRFLKLFIPPIVFKIVQNIRRKK